LQTRGTLDRTGDPPYRATRALAVLLPFACTITMPDSAPILVVNAGSSSLKLAIREKAEPRPIATALLEALGTAEARGTVKLGSAQEIHLNIRGADHDAGLAAALGPLAEALGDPLPIRACGHRIVHGGEQFSCATRIDDQVLDGIRACAELAPLHNPPAIRAIEAMAKLMPDLPQVAVFDTAFHQTMPPHAYRYAVPAEWYDKHRVRRYGFHGTSYRYLLAETAQRLGRPADELHLLLAHLGNGCSAAAVRDGHGVDTSMGLTPLEGMAMGTRSGDVDPNLIRHMTRTTKLSAAEVLDQLQRQSGLLGLSGQSHDMREILRLRSTGDPRAALAFEVFCYRIARSLMSLTTGLARVDALVFSGGIGEHSAPTRARVLDHLAILGPKVDAARNAANGTDPDGRITTDSSALTALVVPTDEERMIARETRELLKLAP
jgi:acetate kinase